ncbi:MAG: ribose-5-phosphate isomerase RpiA [Francisellaceae bacterium]|nr:ribose-5-phosphate isomerase RpiA [Francisellaceae bacterium]MBT6208137.1 ribose-5-phosphate isomerase RpiA [Francisellaceae bacterium]MBT6539926.1 ribose-5-phosphate isomerase RpiA [Francisellaceae bacterium]
MNLQDELKQKSAASAIDFINHCEVIGIGTGSTVDFFIEELAKHQDLFTTTVASSIRTEIKLKEFGINVSSLKDVNGIDVYIDGADSCNPLKQLVKGGGGALTREKILAHAAKQFICIIDEAKTEDYLGKFPVPIEVLPFARSQVAKEIVKLKGNPVMRIGFTTDNGNEILDVHNWVISNPIELEQTLNNIPGVICNGIFALDAADLVLIGTKDKVSICD